MSRHLVYAPSFRDDIRQYLRYMRDQHVGEAIVERWFNALFDRIEDLPDWPSRYPVDPIMTRDSGRETRKLNMGNYLVFYQIDEPGKAINVVAFMHGARRSEA